MFHDFSIFGIKSSQTLKTESVRISHRKSTLSHHFIEMSDSVDIVPAIDETVKESVKSSGVSRVIYKPPKVDQDLYQAEISERFDNLKPPVTSGDHIMTF